MFGRLGWPEALLIILVVVLIFGHSKIPNVMKNLANGINTFKKEMKKGDDKKPVPKGASKEPAKKAVVKTPAKKTAKSKK